MPTSCSSDKTTLRYDPENDGILVPSNDDASAVERVLSGHGYQVVNIRPTASAMWTPGGYGSARSIRAKGWIPRWMRMTGCSIRSSSALPIRAQFLEERADRGLEAKEGGGGVGAVEVVDLPALQIGAHTGKRSDIRGRCSLSSRAMMRLATVKSAPVALRGIRSFPSTLTPWASKARAATGEMGPTLRMPRSRARPRESGRQVSLSRQASSLNRCSARRLRL